MSYVVFKLTKSYEYSYVMSGGHRIISHSFIVFYKFLDHNEVLDFFKRKEFTDEIQNVENHVIFSVGIIASRKVGNAVMRNRCKRIIRIAIRSIAKSLNRKTNLVFAIIARKNLVTKKSYHVEEELQKCLYPVFTKSFRR